MKKLSTLILLLAWAMNAFPQAQGIYTNCPTDVVFSQNYNDINAYWYAYDAWDKTTTMRPALENYVASSSFNSLRIWGGWVIAHLNGESDPACHPDATEPFRVEIYDQNPAETSASPVHSFTLEGVLTKIGYADYARSGMTQGRYAWNEPMYQVDLSFPMDIEVLNGWISIRNLNDATRPCSFAIVYRPYDLTNSFYCGNFTQQAGGGYSGGWGTPINGNVFMCLAHNAVPFAGSPVRRFDQTPDNWTGLSPAWQAGGTSLAPADDFTTSGSFNTLSIWGGWVFGTNTSCTVGATENFLVEIYAGDPATHSSTHSLTLPGTVTPTAETFYGIGGQQMYRIDIAFPSPITMTTGWLRVMNVSPAGRTCQFGWLNSTQAVGSYRDENSVIQPGGLYFSLSTPCPTDFANAGPDITVYYGYPPLAGDSLHASGGIWYDWSPVAFMVQTANYGWNPYVHRPDVYVQPDYTITYDVTVTDVNGCTDSDAVKVTVVDVRCGKKMDMVVVCSRGKTLCVPKSKVAALLAGGATLGPCTRGAGEYFVDDDMISEEVSLHAAPNPVLDDCEIVFEQPDDGPVTIRVIDLTGHVVSTVHDGFLGRGSHRFQWTRPASAATMYLLIARKADQVEIIKLITQ